MTQAALNVAVELFRDSQKLRDYRKSGTPLPEGIETILDLAAAGVDDVRTLEAAEALEVAPETLVEALVAAVSMQRVP